jgi:hypothetical protein
VDDVDGAVSWMAVLNCETGDCAESNDATDDGDAFEGRGGTTGNSSGGATSGGGGGRSAGSVELSPTVPPPM